MNPTPPLTPKTKNKANSLIIMALIAVFLGLVAAGGIWQYLIQAQKKVKELSVTRAVVVANKELTAGVTLTEADILIKQVSVQAVPKDYPTSISQIKGRIVKTTIQPEEIISEARLVPKGSIGGGLPVVIPPGMRAFTIRVNEVIGVGGFLKPGDCVDIIANVKKENIFHSKIILQNLLVLAVGDKILDPDIVADPLAKIVSQVTIALSPRDVEKLALAIDAGQIHLALRPFGEGKNSLTDGAGLEDVYGYIAQSPKDSLTQPASLLPDETEKNSVEVILGSQKSYFYY